MKVRENMATLASEEVGMTKRNEFIVYSVYIGFRCCRNGVLHESSFM